MGAPLPAAAVCFFIGIIIPYISGFVKGFLKIFFRFWAFFENSLFFHVIRWLFKVKTCYLIVTTRTNASTNGSTKRAASS